MRLGCAIPDIDVSGDPWSGFVDSRRLCTPCKTESLHRQRIVDEYGGDESAEGSQVEENRGSGTCDAGFYSKR